MNRQNFEFEVEYYHPGGPLFTKAQFTKEVGVASTSQVPGWREMAFPDVQEVVDYLVGVRDTLGPAGLPGITPGDPWEDGVIIVRYHHPAVPPRVILPRSLSSVRKS